MEDLVKELEDLICDCCGLADYEYCTYKCNKKSEIINILNKYINN